MVQLKPLLALGMAALAVGAIVGLGTLEQNTAADHHAAHQAGGLLAMTFAHADHTEQACIECHHNFVDDTGQGLCIDCHKTHEDVAHLIEEQFHDLCRGCHEKEQRLAVGDSSTLTGDHGPTRECRACHTPDAAP